MLAPVLEIYVVWHPGDSEGERVAALLLDHFRGTTFSGLIGGAVEVFVRSVSATGDQRDAPRPLPCVEAMPTVCRVLHLLLWSSLLGLNSLRPSRVADRGVNTSNVWRERGVNLATLSGSFRCVLPTTFSIARCSVDWWATYSTLPAASSAPTSSTRPYAAISRKALHRWATVRIASRCS